MKTRDNTRARFASRRALARLIVILTIACAFQLEATAQTTPADTPIENTATATYNDTSGGNYIDKSNKLTVNVSKV